MRGRRVWLALGVLLLLASGAAVVVPLIRGAATAGEPVPSSTTVRGLACVEIAPGDSYCDRLLDDLARRDPLSESDRKAAGRSVELLREAFVAHLGSDCAAAAKICAFPAPPTVEEVHAALVAAGLPGPVVRLARYTDPAPFDAIVYAVRAGYACLVGFIEHGAGAQPQTVGRHRDGNCLPP